jgi:hypothetical protein
MIVLEQSFSRLIQFYPVNHHSAIASYRPLRFAIALIRQHIITSSYHKLEALSLTEHLIACGVRKLVGSFSVRVGGFNLSARL